MTPQEEQQLRNKLNELDKEHIIELFIKLKKIYQKTSERLSKTEDELIEKTSLNELLASISDDNTHTTDYFYEKCPYYVQEEVNKSSVFDHPDYQCYCTKTGNKRPLYLPINQCKRCMNTQKTTR